VALVFPAKLRDASPETLAGIAIGAEHYVHQTEWFRSQLRLIG
jgi:hypothetical protein